MDVLLNMFFVYNAIIHSSIVLVNFGIILKEIALEFERLANLQEGEETFGLGPRLLYSSSLKIFHIMDPFELIPRMFKFLAGSSLDSVLTIAIGAPYLSFVKYFY